MIFTNSFKKTEIRLLIAITILTLLFACTNEGERHVVPNDYMTPELRARVDQLKSDLASEATNESSIVERADLLADWIDAYAMAGGEVGIDAPRVRLQATLAPCLLYTSPSPRD